MEHHTAESIIWHRPEEWTVAGRRCTLSSSISTIGGGFRDLGVVRPGTRVRIADVGGAIARLEVAR